MLLPNHFIMFVPQYWNMFQFLFKFFLRKRLEYWETRNQQQNQILMGTSYLQALGNNEVVMFTARNGISNSGI